MAPCPWCGHAESPFPETYLDPYTQAQLAVWLPRRGGILMLHAHGAIGPPATLGVTIHTWARLSKFVAVPAWTPRSLTVNGAFVYLDEVVRRERERLARRF